MSGILKVKNSMSKEEALVKFDEDHHDDMDEEEEHKPAARKQPTATLWENDTECAPPSCFKSLSGVSAFLDVPPSPATPHIESTSGR